ncbi:sigma factor G inhibitor Gin [Gracilibacillus sp. YIM 98692]|uniref:sigma factor G inhibitor Gin n=1 Tax=Gracilibacillus sp. YIM 98692 TaxID=2663532 RepID=UPI0013D4C1DE|nr:sigma factor G inhibitor Gin [Gracilibacillus sp. YIM 98692]
MSEKVIQKHCGICEKEKEDGIFLYHFFICSECEKEIVNTKPGESNYQMFVKKLRAINQSSYTL